MNKKDAAFSLIEVAIAIGLIAFALVAILGLVPVGLKSEAESTQRLRAVQSLNMIAEDICSVARPYVESAGPDATPNPVPTPASTTPHYRIPFPSDTQPDVAGTLYLDDQLNLLPDGAPLGDRRYVAHYHGVRQTGFSNQPDLWNTSTFQIIVAWPGIMDFEGAAPSLKLKKFQGFVENTITVSRL